MSTHEEAIEAASLAVHFAKDDADATELASLAISTYLAARSAVLCSSEPVAWRWRFDESGNWHFGVNEPRGSSFRFGKPDDIEPVHAPLSPTDTATAGRVEVKALEWKYYERPMLTYVASDARGKMYHIDQGFGSDSYYFTTVRFDGVILYDGDDLPSAQAAAQQDYETKVLSCLTHPQSINGDEVERLREALGGAIEWMSCVEPHLQDTQQFKNNIASYRAALSAIGTGAEVAGLSTNHHENSNAANELGVAGSGAEDSDPAALSAIGEA